MTLDPEPLFQRLIDDLPDDLHAHVFVVGSLAAAYHFRVELQRQGVNTEVVSGLMKDFVHHDRDRYLKAARAAANPAQKKALRVDRK